jgi:hypothetical protein
MSAHQRYYHTPSASILTHLVLVNPTPNSSIPGPSSSNVSDTVCSSIPRLVLVYPDLVPVNPTHTQT